MTELKTYKGYALWLYLPNTAAAALFTALFALGTAAVAWRMFKTRAWFCTVFILGGLRTCILRGIYASCVGTES